MNRCMGARCDCVTVVFFYQDTFGLVSASPAESSMARACTFSRDGSALLSGANGFLSTIGQCCGTNIYTAYGAGLRVCGWEPARVVDSERYLHNLSKCMYLRYFGLWIIRLVW